MKRDLVLTGIIITCAGLYMYFTGWANRFQAPVPPALAVLSTVVGVVVILIGIFPTKKIRKKRYYVCTTCQKKYNAKHVEILICSLCDSALTLMREEEFDK